jgi:O-antigen/teichoic acid export membrane protein
MSLGKKAAGGAAWNVVMGLGGRAVGLVATLALTRFLDPTEYGEVSVAV